jgi:NAD(P)-dependent dehydrogenase (short-subunit alcohol dehydrogenase family)
VSAFLTKDKCFRLRNTIFHSDPNGIGFLTAEQLALKGAKVYIGARSQEKCVGAIQAMHSRAGAEKTLNLAPLVMDLASLQQAKQAAYTFLQKETRLDILLNNAAM